MYDGGDMIGRVQMNVGSTGYFFFEGPGGPRKIWSTLILYLILQFPLVRDLSNILQLIFFGLKLVRLQLIFITLLSSASVKKNNIG
jgi:hypothetical protein